MSYHSAKQDKLITLREYVDTLCENQTEIYYACGESIEAIRTLPQYKYLIDKGFDVLLMTENVDEFMVKMMNGYDGKPFKSITDNDIHAVFSDELRDGLCGPVWKKEKGAFLAGVPGAEMSVKFGIVGAIEHPQVRCDSVNYSQKPWAEQPTQMISYVSCHDGLCLVDRLKASMPGATPEQLVRLDKLAQTVVFTSQGIPFIYAGEEVMRDKQGVDNSYKSPDAVNAIDWRRKTTNGDVFMYYKRLIDLRKSHPAFRMGDAEKVRKHLEFLPVEGQNLIAFRLKDHANGDSWEDIIVAFNSRMTPARLEVPVGKYTVVCKDGVIDVRGLGTQIGPEVIIPGQSALIMYK